MPEILKCFIQIFADDTKVYTAMQSEEHCRLLQNSKDQLVQWTKDWQMKFNKDKCKILHVGEKESRVQIFYRWQGASVCRGRKRPGSFC